jgi:hypothetical protein
MIAAADRGPLGNEEVVPGLRIIHIGVDFGGKIALDIAIHERLNRARQLRGPGSQ